MLCKLERKYVLPLFVYILILGLVAASYLEERAKLVVKIDDILGQKYLSKKLFKHHYGMPGHWLKELGKLSKNSLSILLLQPVNKEPWLSYQGGNQTLINHIQTLLLPNNFFCLKNMKIEVPKSVRLEIFMSLHLDQIANVLISNEASTTAEGAVFNVINQEETVSKLCDLAVKELGCTLREILAQVPELKAITRPIWVDSIDTYRQLIQLIRQAIIRRQEEEQIKQVLRFHPLLASQSLSFIFESRDMKWNLEKVVINIIKKQLSWGYQRFLLSFTVASNISTFLLSGDCLVSLTDHVETWTNFLDQLFLWLIKLKKVCSLAELIKSSFKIGIKSIDHLQLTTWQQVANKYLEIRRLDFPNHQFIITHQQLETLNMLSIEDYYPTNESVWCVCKLVSLIKPEELKFRGITNNTLWINLLNGTFKALKELKEPSPVLFPFLETIFLETDYNHSFLEILSESNETGYNLAAIDKFVKYLKDQKALKSTVLKLVYKISMAIDIFTIQFEEINTFQGLLKYIENTSINLGHILLNKVDQKDLELMNLLKDQPFLLSKLIHANLKTITRQNVGDLVYELFEGVQLPFHNDYDVYVLTKILQTYSENKQEIVNKLIRTRETIVMLMPENVVNVIELGYCLEHC